MRLRNILVIIVMLLFLISCNKATQTSGQQETVKEQSTAQEFKRMLSEKANLEYKIDYDYVMNNSIVGIMQTRMTEFQKRNKTRTDITSPNISGRDYLIDNIMTTCINIDGTGWYCSKSDIQKDNLAETEKDIKQNTDNYNVVADGTRIIAGTNTKCYNVFYPISYNPVGEKMKYCFSSDGLPLYTMYEDVYGSFELTATNFSRDVSDAEFELPINS